MPAGKLANNRSIIDDLKQLDILLSKAMAESLHGEPVTATQAGVLLFLAGRQGLTTPNRAIEEHFNISNPAASTMVKRLEAKGFVCTSIDPNDKRCHCVSITEAGLAAASSADCKVKALDSVIYGSFTAEERAAASELVKRMVVNLQDR